MDNNIRSIGVVGGGLAGLCFAIQCAKAGFEVSLFEKGQYPSHKVCGEYISKESYSFLCNCGVDMIAIGGIEISKLMVSAPNGSFIENGLDLGGIGISRYLLDYHLFLKAVELGVKVHQGTRVTNINKEEAQTRILTTNDTFLFDFVAGSFGKRSNIDIAWKRQFIDEKPNKLNNYVGIKYHVKYNMPQDLIALHNFKNGYAGISRIENDQFCLCYLTTAQNLKEQGSIKNLEQNVLCGNPHLRKIFEQATFLYEAPLTIAQVSFAQKDQCYDDIPLLGDSAGLITPLCGNGMSMAMHSSKILANLLALQPYKSSIKDVTLQYTLLWHKEFSLRLKVGKIIQRSFGNKTRTDLLIKTLQVLPFIKKAIIKRTHGKPF
jgi:menaquinone-9 beta-reductase